MFGRGRCSRSDRHGNRRLRSSLYACCVLFSASHALADSFWNRGVVEGTNIPPTSMYSPSTTWMVTTSGLPSSFMTFAWYAHLKHLEGRPWIVAALVSWSIALFEYLLQVPANRIGYSELSLPQLKILQEVVALGVFVPFVIFYMRQPLKLDYLWASLCMLAAVYFIFRNGVGEDASTPDRSSHAIAKAASIAAEAQTDTAHPEQPEQPATLGAIVPNR